MLQRISAYMFRTSLVHHHGTHNCTKHLLNVKQLFCTNSAERAWKAIGDRLQRPNYLSRVDHELKIRNRRQMTDIEKYSFVNRLPAEILGTLPCKLNVFRKRVRKVINVVN